MSDKFDRYTGWTAPLGTAAAYARLARELGHTERDHDCVGRRQGLCPGLEFCHDCQWSEGSTREK